MEQLKKKRKKTPTSLHPYIRTLPHDVKMKRSSGKWSKYEQNIMSKEKAGCTLIGSAIETEMICYEITNTNNGNTNVY